MSECKILKLLIIVCHFKHCYINVKNTQHILSLKDGL